MFRLFRCSILARAFLSRPYLTASRFFENKAYNPPVNKTIKIPTHTKVIETPIFANKLLTPMVSINISPAVIVLILEINVVLILSLDNSCTTTFKEVSTNSKLKRRRKPERTMSTFADNDNKMNEHKSKTRKRLIANPLPIFLDIFSIEADATAELAKPIDIRIEVSKGVNCLSDNINWLKFSNTDIKL